MSFDKCEWHASKGCYGDCRHCPFGCGATITSASISDEGEAKKPVLPKRRYRMGAAHRTTSLRGVSRCLSLASFRALAHEYGVPSDLVSVARITAYAENNTRRYGRMTIAEEIIRDYNKGKTRYA